MAQPQKKNFVRRSYFIDAQMVAKIRKLTGAKTEAEALRRVMAGFVEQQRFWNFLQKTSGNLPKGSFRP